MGSDKYNEAINALEKMEQKFLNMQNEDLTEKVFLTKNTWDTLVETMATPGVLMCQISSPEDSNIQNIVYIPKNGAVKPHFHQDKVETIVVISGQIHYKLYESDKYSKVISEGVLDEFEVLEIENKRTHFVFTSKTEAYIRIDFKNVNNHENN